MNKLKLSKTSWLILSAGVFLVVLAGLGLTRSQQIQDQVTVQDELSISSMRLSNSNTSEMRYQIEELQQQIDMGKAQLDDAIARLEKTVISADVTEDFYAIAEFSNVEVMQFNSSPIAQSSLVGVRVSQTAISAQVVGNLGEVIDFIININNSYTTGYIQRATLQVELPPSDNEDILSVTRANIDMIIYSYEG
ncbi:MAG: hypothetical protein MUO19_03240 [Dehalococcoidales bacterium]|nr:hypothetical protein [Dehalococcoidales bacterium]